MDIVLPEFLLLPEKSFRKFDNKLWKIHLTYSLSCLVYEINKFNFSFNCCSSFKEFDTFSSNYFCCQRLRSIATLFCWKQSLRRSTNLYESCIENKRSHCRLLMDVNTELIFFLKFWNLNILNLYLMKLNNQLIICIWNWSPIQELSNS